MAVGNANVWAVGDVTYRNGPDYVPLVFDRSAGSWSSLPFKLAVPGCKSFARGVLVSVVESRSGLYVAGWCQFENFQGPNGPQRSYIARRTGNGWTLAYEAPQGEEITALAAAPDGEIWAGGDTGTPGVFTIRGLLWHGSAAHWSQVPIPGGKTVGGRIRAVAATTTAVYAAGSYVTSSGVDVVVAFDPLTQKSAIEPIAPIAPGSVNANALVAVPNGASWLGGSVSDGNPAGAQAILARRSG